MVSRQEAGHRQFIRVRSTASKSENHHRKILRISESTHGPGLVAFIFYSYFLYFAFSCNLKVTRIFQVNVPTDIGQAVVKRYYTDRQPERGLFSDIYLTLFPIVFRQWKRYCLASFTLTAKLVVAVY